MTTVYRGRGDTVRYTPSGADIAAGEWVDLGHCLGVAIADIADGEEGVLAIEGVFLAPKVSAAVFAVGEKLIWDTSADSGAGEFDDSSAVPATGDLTGAAIAMQAGLNGETTCLVKLTPGNVTKTA